MPKKSKPAIHFQLKIQGQNSWFSPSSYSKFYKRLKALDEKKLVGDIYGLDQAIEHANELRRFRYEGNLIHAQAIFEIEKVTTITVISKVLKPKK